MCLVANSGGEMTDISNLLLALHDDLPMRTSHSYAKDKLVVMLDRKSKTLDFQEVHISQ